MKSWLVPLFAIFFASVAHVLLFLILTSRAFFSDEAIIVLLIILPALMCGLLFGASYGFVSVSYGIFFFLVYLTIGGLGFIDRTTPGAVKLGWEVEFIICSGIVVVSNLVGAVPASIAKMKR